MAPEIYFPFIGIKINKLNRVAFEVFGLDIYWYGLIIASSIFIGYLMIDKYLKKQKSSIDEYLNFIFLVIFTSIVGARTYYVAFSWNYYKNHLSQILNLRNGGIAIYGGVIAAILTAIIYAKVTKKSFYKIADLFSPFLILGQAMGRWGNFFNREAFGSTTNSLLSMALRVDTVSSIPPGSKAIFEYFGDKYIQVHPTFLYESIACFIIFIYLIIRRNKGVRFDGEIFASYIMLYSFARFFVEGLRTDQLLIFNIPISQIIAILLFLIGLIIFIVKFKKAKTQNKKHNKLQKV